MSKKLTPGLFSQFYLSIRKICFDTHWRPISSRHRTQFHSRTNLPSYTSVSTRNRSKIEKPIRLENDIVSWRLFVEIYSQTEALLDDEINNGYITCMVG